MGNGTPAPPPQGPAIPNALGELIVTVTNPATDAVQAIVSVRIKSLEETRQQPTNRNGVAVFEKMPVGTHVVTVDAAGHGLVPAPGQPFKAGPTSLSVKVTPGPDPTEVFFILTLPVGFLRVLVRKPDRAVLPGIEVEIVGKPGKKTNAQGIADFGGQPAGVFFVIKAGPLDPKTKPFVGPVSAPPNAVTIGRVETTKSLAIGEVVTVPMELEERRLDIVKIDPQFAPSKENLEIRFSILGLDKRVVKLTIEGDNYTGKTMLERNLTDAETARGDQNLIAWDGKIAVGVLKDKFANPLLGPFRVRLFHDDTGKVGVLKSEKTFKILYHSIELSFGKHTPDGALPPEAEQNKFVQAKLNELNYGAGPIDGTLNPVTTSALRRFQRGHYKVGTTDLLKVDGLVTADVIAALKAATPLQIFNAANPLTQDSRFYVHDNYLNDRNDDVVIGTGSEFQAHSRTTSAENNLERPFIPLEVLIKIMNKAGAGVEAPEAVGEAPISFEVTDAPEDATLVPAATNPLARTYIQHAREIGMTATVAGAARIDANGDNALITFSGFRDSNSANYIQQFFPNDSGNKLLPYSIARYDKETRAGKEIHFALVKAFAHPTDHPRCKGRAGIYLRLSKVGGDDAKVRAALNFIGLPNAAQLNTDHTSVKANLAKETGRWTTFRRTRISAYCKQTTPSRASGAPDFAQIRDRWAEAFIEVENNGQPLTTLNYTTVVTAAAYRAAILALPTGAAVTPTGPRRPAGISVATDITYRPGSIYGGVDLPQLAAEDPNVFLARVLPQMKNWCIMPVTVGTNTTETNGPINAVLKLLHAEARKTSPEGWVIFDFRMHDEVTARVWNPALNAGVGGFQASPNPSHANVRSATAGYVRVSGAVTMCVDNRHDVNCYVAHECGHSKFLVHHRHVPEAPSPATSAFPAEHDAKQDKCTMSYPAPGDTPENWRYRFCGKCILQLRGWSLGFLPNQYT